jgi:hypothetical protein
VLNIKETKKSRNLLFVTRRTFYDLCPKGPAPRLRTLGAIVMSRKSFERVCRAHAVLSATIACAIYSGKVREIVNLLGVAQESEHSLRNTSLLLFLTAFLSASVVFPWARHFPTVIGKFLVLDEADLVGIYVAGLTACVNFLLLCHYTVEAFTYASVSKTAVLFGWSLTVFALLGVKIAITSDTDNKSKKKT